MTLDATLYPDGSMRVRITLDGKRVIDSVVRSDQELADIVELYCRMRRDHIAIEIDEVPAS